MRFLKLGMPIQILPSSPPFCLFSTVSGYLQRALNGFSRIINFTTIILLIAQVVATPSVMMDEMEVDDDEGSPPPPLLDREAFEKELDEK